ncbi:MAG: radical SAM protein [Alphaproteobacteria bacterium]|nr:radical SAM protein [Alphaproteobacteria bacterium]
MPIPESLQVKQLDMELNGGCNYKCEMCPQVDGREKDFLKKLPLDVFEKVVDDAMAYGLESVSLHGSGEPSLNANMPDFVRVVKDRGLKCISFTNGSKLTEELARRLIEAKIDVLRFSVIGYDRDSYQRWMSKDLFEDVRVNARRFVELNAELGGSSQLHLYHLVTDAERIEDEVAAYQTNWVTYTGGFAEIWMMHNWSGEYTGGFDRAASQGRPKRRSCGRPFSPLLQVRAGGLEGHNAAVVACCMVLGKDSQAVLGHLDSQSIAEVVCGEPYEALRAAHREERFDDIPYCAGCDQLYDFPNALVWSNIPGRQYGESKVVAGLDHRKFAES